MKKFKLILDCDELNLIIDLLYEFRSSVGKRIYIGLSDHCKFSQINYLVEKVLNADEVKPDEL